MAIPKRTLNIAAISAGVLCGILLIAMAAMYFEYPPIIANRDSQITAKSNQIDNINGNQTALQSQVDSLNTQKNNLQKELNGNVTALANANSQIANLTKQINFWKAFVGV